jgi:DNA-binding winged helix-turn-helix (wHTH) protein
VGWHRFGSFELDLGGFVLKRGNQVLPLQPKVFDVLRYLVERPGALVTKDELLHELWHDEDVNENVIAWSVSHIRRALGQQRGARIPIETIAGRGYRFTAELTSSDSSPPEPGAPSTETRHQSILVGRARVMSELQERVQETAAGHGSLSVLTGEAGIGKTRCVDELASVAAGLGLKMLLGRCTPEATAPPLWPIAMALRGVAHDQPEIVARARRLLSGFGDEAPALEQAGGGRFWRIEQATRVLRDLAAANPLLLVLDDLQWADASSLDLLGLLAPDLRELRLCVVLTLRDGELQSGSPRDQPLRRVLRHAKTIPLGALDTTQVAELIKVVGKHSPSPDLAEAVRRAAGGIPLFVEEIVRSLVLEHGAEAIDQLPAHAVRVPPLARDLLRERMTRLPQLTTKLLSAAAVIGESFDLSLLLSAVELEPEVLLEGLEPALAQGQIKSDAPHAYRFVHSLFQSVLYDSVPMSERVALHRRLATLLMARPGDELRQSEIARHFYLSLPAGDHLVVMEQTRKAGVDAQRVFAYEDAVVYYTWALEAQSFGGTADPRTRAELLLSLATAQRSAGRTHDALETTARVLELSQQHRLHDLLVQAARLRRPTVAMSMVPDPLARSALELVLEQLPDEASPTRVSALSQLAYIPPYANDLERSKALSERAEALARELPGNEPTLEAMRARLFSLSGPDDVEQVLQVADRMLAAEQAQRTWYTGDALGARLSAYTLQGRIAEADAVLAQMQQGISQQHWPEATFFCGRLAAQRRFLDGEFDASERLWKALHAQASRAGVSYADMFYGTFTVTLAIEREGAKAAAARGLLAGGSLMNMTPAMRASFARVSAESGQHEVARTQLSTLGDPSDYPRDGHYLNLLANLSVCASRVDDKARCEQLLSLLTPFAEFNTPSQMGYYLGCVAYFLGLLSEAVGRSVAAGSHFERALLLNRGMGYRAGVVRTLLAHGELSLRLGHRNQARDLLTRARNEAEALGMRGASEDALSALART